MKTRQELLREASLLKQKLARVEKQINLTEVKRMQKIAGILKEVSREELENQERTSGMEVQNVKFPNGTSFQVGGHDMEGGKVIAIMKLKDGYAVSGMEYDWDNDMEGEEGYTYYYDLEGNEVM